MTLEEMLDHLGSHILDDRTELLDGAPDSMFSDEVLVRYLNSAQELFCRKAWPIVDQTTAACCEVTLVTDQTDYSVHRSVIRVLSAVPQDSDIPLLQLNWNLMSNQPTPGFPDFLENRFAYTYPSGRPAYFSLDQATRTLRVRPKPSAEQVAAIVKLKLRVARMPITPLSVATPLSSPEIPDEFHLDLCNYAGGRALVQANLDAGDVKRGRDLIAEFMANIRSAKVEKAIAQTGPGRWIFGGWAQHNDGLK